MPLLISGIRTGLCETEQDVIDHAIHLLGSEQGMVRSASLNKRSLDARRKDHITWVSSVRLELEKNEEQLAARLADRLGTDRVKYWKEEPLCFCKGTQRMKHAPVVAGFGPAGMFAALVLAEQGYRPVILERGPAMEERVASVSRFWQEGVFSPEANVQFGEGGAGTFSDGKLTTRISDSRCDYVLRRLVEFGAPDEILVRAKPHIGTDLLRGVVRNLRERVLALGGQIQFETKLTGLKQNGGSLKAVCTSTGELAAEQLILAVGHSARDTFSMLLQSGIEIEAKPFSVGVRAEHLQSDIDCGLYGNLAGHPALPPGEYQLSYRENGRGVYTFCMCPGGVVVPAASEADTIVTNGMSEFSRSGANANAAIAVSVSPEDYGTSPLDGMYFQRELEQKAFLMGGGRNHAPAQDVGSFLAGRPGLRLGRVMPTYACGVEAADLRLLFPGFVTDMLEKGLRQFEKRLPGFGAVDTVLTGPETRTSSPVRILRNGDYQSPSCKGLYPCGEGAGYAGGIMSAAVDGLRIAQEMIRQYAPSRD